MLPVGWLVIFEGVAMWVSQHSCSMDQCPGLRVDIDTFVNFVLITNTPMIIWLVCHLFSVVLTCRSRGAWKGCGISHVIVFFLDQYWTHAQASQLSLKWCNSASLRRRIDASPHDRWVPDQNNAQNPDHLTQKTKDCCWRHWVTVRLNASYKCVLLFPSMFSVISMCIYYSQPDPGQSDCTSKPCHCHNRRYKKTHV